MTRRRRAREFALQLLFEAEITRDQAGDVLARFWSAHSADMDVRAFAERLMRGTLEHLPALDAGIASVAEHWRLERMAAVDRNVLRMAVYELTHERSTPAAVVIDEAIEVARKFGGEESGSFINGILDALRRGMEREAGAT